MEKMTFEFDINPNPQTPPNPATRVTCGVVGSGNLEVIIEPNDNSQKTLFEINTSVEHYQKIWELVIQDFVKEYQPSGLKFTLNDNGAISPVVSIRLKQALEAYHGYQKTSQNYVELDAHDRIQSIVEPYTFIEWLGDEKTYSPHLPALNIPCEADDGIVIGEARLKGKDILIAAQKKDFMGGAVGEIHGAKLTGLFKAAIHKKVHAVILLIDSGGVRLHEANAGEIAISEMIRAILDARHQGIVTIGVVCGKNGAFGGIGITSACLDYLITNEIGRIGVSGAEVIQAVKGIEAFNAQDRGLIWRVYGGKTRYLQQVVQHYVSFDIHEISLAIQAALDKSCSLDLNSLKQQHELLKKRFENAGDAQEEGQYLTKNFPKIAENIFDSNQPLFLEQASKILGSH